MTLYNYEYEHTEDDWDGNGRCPHCGEYDSEVLDEGAEDEYYYYVMRCYNCNTRFTDWYKMVPREREWVTADEMREQEEEQDRRPVSRASSELPSELLPAMPISVPPSELPHVELRHNYDLAPVSDNPLLDVLSQAQADSATRNLRMPKANWQAINEALNES